MVGAVPAPFEDEHRDEGGPAGLVAGAETGAVVAREVLVERQVLRPVDVVLQPLDAAEAGSSSGGASKGQLDEPVGELVGHLTEVVPIVGPRGVLDGGRVTEAVMKPA